MIHNTDKQINKVQQNQLQSIDNNNNAVNNNNIQKNDKKQTNTFRNNNKNNHIISSQYQNYQDQSLNQQQQTINNNNKSNKFKSIIIIVLIIVAVILLIVLLTIAFKTKQLTSDSQTYQLFKINSTSARCLDGSPVPYYVSQTGDPQKLLIYLMGGAWCLGQTQQKVIQACYQRTKWFIGSSNYSPTFTTRQHGVLGKSQSNYFKNWKKIILEYCDGSGRQGTIKQPIQYENTQLYFRGHNNTVQQFQQLQKRFGLFTKASKVVLAGDSAGGLSVMTWSNYLQQRVKTKQYYAIQDCGIFWDAQNKLTKRHTFRQGFVNLMNLVNKQIQHPVTQCVKDYPHMKQNCMFTQYLYKYIKAPLFSSPSLYDSYSLQNINGIQCINDMKNCSQQDKELIQENRLNVRSVLLQIGKNAKYGLWGISCPRHETLLNIQYLDDKWAVPYGSKYTLNQAIANWMQYPYGNNIYQNEQRWPGNQGCA